MVLVVGGAVVWIRRKALVTSARRLTGSAARVPRALASSADPRSVQNNLLGSYI
jgi:hypothetical protein